MALFQALGVVERGAQAGGDIVGDMVAADRNHCGMLHRSVMINGDVGRAAADVDQRDAQFPFLVGKHRLCHCQRRQHNLRNIEAAAVAALDDILHRGHRPGDNVHLRFETDSGHAKGIPDAVLIIDDVILRQNVEHLAIHRDRHRLGGIDHPP